MQDVASELNTENFHRCTLFLREQPDGHDTLCSPCGLLHVDQGRHRPIGNELTIVQPFGKRGIRMKHFHRFLELFVCRIGLLCGFAHG